PVANDTYILQDYNFNLINIWEFLNDRYASLMVSWDMNGKILNRIPLLKKLKWREWIGVNVLWGTLTNKNNPAASGFTDPALFFFPGRFNGDGTYESNTYKMDAKKPYIEVVAGVHNIFKLFHVVYVRRLTYLDHPNINKNGVRFIFRMSF
ncbi:MAG: carboxypeptidase-like regulatory domain-containing protein, partial [Bacteroidaceae bacterium]|nr:carboxypeptidase-like regulatory domain-containing protein [Bacteroidaceae bacterium]